MPMHSGGRIWPLPDISTDNILGAGYTADDGYFDGTMISNTYAKKFQKNYRNVLVLPKLTFPDEKVLRLEISENQISGRVIVLTIEYEDILNADGFDSDILKNSDYYPYYYIKYSVEQ